MNCYKIGKVISIQKHWLIKYILLKKYLKEGSVIFFIPQKSSMPRRMQLIKKGNPGLTESFAIIESQNPPLDKFYALRNCR